MSVKSNTGVVTDGLAFCLDAANLRSYSGTGTSSKDLASNLIGSLVNGVTFDSSNGGSFVFDGTNDQIVVSHNSNIAFTSSLTDEVWFKLDSFPTGTNRYTLCTKWASYYMNVYSNRKISVYTYWNNGNRANSSYTDSTSSLSLNTWHHVVFTESTSGLRKIYIDGQLDKTEQKEAGIWNEPNVLYIGGQPSRPLNGNIARVNLYSRELSSGEVLQNYNALKNRFI